MGWHVCRVMVNEEEVVKVLKEGNMISTQVVDLGSMSFREQLKVRHVAWSIASHSLAICLLEVCLSGCNWSCDVIIGDAALQHLHRHPRGRPHARLLPRRRGRLHTHVSTLHE
jgi:hypothetical protein